MKAILFSLMALLFLSCQKKEIKNHESVFDEIFLTLVDSIHHDMRFFRPPPRPQLDFETNIEDTTGFHKIKIAYENRLKRLKADPSKLVIIIRDSTEFLMPNNQLELSKHFKNISVEIDSSGITKINSEGTPLIRIQNLKAKKIDLKKYVLNPKYDFKYESKTNRKEYNPMRFPDKAFGGFLGFSNIIFDESGQFGMLSASFSCGMMECAQGYNIFIKRIRSQWVIDKIVPTWVT